MDQRNYGFRFPQHDDRDFIFGGQTKLSGAELTDGHWLQYLPQGEPQSNAYVDSFNCTAEGSTNCWEILYKRIFGKERNFSDRALGILAGTRPPGNDPKTVCDAARKRGLIKEESLPFNENIKTVEEYYSPDPLSIELRKEADQFLVDCGLGYERLSDMKPETLKEALKRSPLGVAVKGWYEKDGLYYFPESAQYNHWTCLCDFKENEYWLILDSYKDINGSYLKKIKWDAEFGYGMRYWLGLGLKEQVSILQQIAGLYQKILSLLGIKPKVEPIIIPEEPTKLIEDEGLKWDTKESARYSSRVIMDQYKLSWNEKNLLCAVIEAESGFNTKAINQTTKDYGICQINDYYWIGEGKYFSSIGEVLNNPEKSVRFMIEKYREGKLTFWIAYKNQSYKKYLPKVA